MKLLAGKKVGFTGTQKGTTRPQHAALYGLMKLLNPEEFHHGDCIGADKEAHMIALDLEVLRIYLHPPLNPEKRAWCQTVAPIPLAVSFFELPPLDYLHRNKRIVMRCPNYLIACPKEAKEVRRSGTWSTVRYARQREVKHIYIVQPDGTVVEG